MKAIFEVSDRPLHALGAEQLNIEFMDPYQLSEHQSSLQGPFKTLPVPIWKPHPCSLGHVDVSRRPVDGKFEHRFDEGPSADLYLVDMLGSRIGPVLANQLWYFTACNAPATPTFPP